MQPSEAVLFLNTQGLEVESSVMISPLNFTFLNCSGLCFDFQAFQTLYSSLFFGPKIQQVLASCGGSKGLTQDLYQHYTVEFMQDLESTDQDPDEDWVRS